MSELRAVDLSSEGWSHKVWTRGTDEVAPEAAIRIFEWSRRRTRCQGRDARAARVLSADAITPSEQSIGRSLFFEARSEMKALVPVGRNLITFRLIGGDAADT